LILGKKIAVDMTGAAPTGYNTLYSGGAKSDARNFFS
jgi:hypothetical protein